MDRLIHRLFTWHAFRKAKRDECLERTGYPTKDGWKTNTERVRAWEKAHPKLTKLLVAFGTVLLLSGGIGAFIGTIVGLVWLFTHEFILLGGVISFFIVVLIFYMVDD